MKNKSTLGKFRMIFKNWKIFYTAILLFSSALFFAQTYNTAGVGTWYAPVGVTSITVEVWGAGGGGQGATGNPSAGGGGSGGGFVKTTYTVVPGQTYNFYVGAGGTGGTANNPAGNGENSWFISNSTIKATGGNGAGASVTANNTWGTGATASAENTNTGGTLVSSKGGNGGNAGNAFSGGGGSSAGDVNGIDASNDVGGSAPANGYAGGNGRTTFRGVGANGNIGAGGAGGKANNNSDQNGGNGGTGRIRISYTGYCTPPANTTGCSGDNISSVSLDTLNDTGLTCTPQYATRENAQNAVPNLVQNSTMPMAVGVGNGGAEYVGVWIDYDHDGVFAASEYTALGSGNDIVVNGNINIPIGALIGNTYMRVRSKYNSALGGANACTAVGYGTTRDYKVNIISPPVATLDYIEDFENTHYWSSINGTQTNKWFVGTPVNGETKALYISNSATGGSNTYANTTSVVHSYRDIAIPIGVPKVGIYYDWRANGDIAGNDYFKVWLVPQSYNPVSGIPITEDAGRILLNDKMHGSNNWQPQYNENVDVTSFAGQNLRLVFEWINNATSTVQNAAAIDNVQVKKPCFGTPNAGTASIAPVTGLPSSTFNVSVTGSSAASGLSYQWQISNDGSTGWADISGATSAGTTALTAVPLASTTRYYRRKIICSNGGGVGYSTVVSFITTTASYCTPTSQHPDGLYIKDVAIVGTMADPPVNSTAYAADGYSDYTTLSPIAEQAQGEGVNVLASVDGNTFGRGTWKAWVDWNGDGDFTDAGEEVYNISGFAGAAVNFGFAVPVNQTPGNYRMRIRVNNGFYRGNFGGTYETFGFDFLPCDPFLDNTGYFADKNGYGETEDYLIKVVSNCSAKITAVTNGTECNITGGKQVVLSATASEVVTEFRWYDSPTGASYEVTVPDGTGKATTFTTPAISTTTTYYVTTNNGSCESTFRVPVVAEIKPTPDISFTPSTLEICGESSVVAVSATGANEVVNLFPKQTFEDGTLGEFVVVQTTAMDANSNVVKALTRFQNKTSVLIRPNATPSQGNVWFPAISSGFGANKFVLATSDSKSPNYPASPVQSALTLQTAVSSVGLNNLILKLRIYYSRYWVDNYNPTANEEYVAIEVSTDNGASYPNVIAKLITNQGLGSNFATLNYDLSAYVGQANLKFRIRHYSWAGDGFLPDGVAVDDIELYGERPLAPSFVWTNSNPIGVYTDAAGTIPYTSGPISTVYFKPSPTEIETYENWNVTATASLTNSCNAQGTLNIVNNTKVWNSLSTNWNSTFWKPTSTLPTIDKCVILKKPVIIGANIDGLAKNIKIDTGGKLNILANGSLTVTDGINNTGSASDFLVASDGNLVQVNDLAVNIGAIAVRRAHILTNNRAEYNFLSSPVTDQNMRYIYGNNPANIQYVTVLNEVTNFFVNATAGDYQLKGRGFAVKEPKTTYVDLSGEGLPVNLAQYKGIPNNGAFPVTVTRTSDTRGWNLIGNPYPSNLDLKLFYETNTSTKMSPEFRFWDNRVNATYVQYGGNYNGYSYALYNAESDEGNPAPGGDQGDNTGTPGGTTEVAGLYRFVKVGQGFLVRATTAGSLNYNNGQRTIQQPDRAFFGKNTSEKNRYRLQLISPEELYLTQTIVYYPGGNNAFGIEDSKYPSSSSSDAFYSYSDAEKVIINGRSSFAITDVVALGNRCFEAGTYKIRAIDRIGIFANGQSIYLKDKELGMITDLTEGAYTFTSNSGEFTNRFEIVYEPGIVLAADNTGRANIQLYRDQLDFVVQSSVKKIDNVELYDMSGRLIMNQKANAKVVRFNAETLIDGAYILKAKMEDGEIFIKKLRK